MIDGPAATGYPIVNYEYAVVKSVQPDAAKASALRAFLRWVITTGNRPVLPEGPRLPAAAAARW